MRSDLPTGLGAATPARELPMRMRAGRLLDAAGQVGLPLGLGATAGYFASDRGVALYPTMLQSLLALGIASLLFVLVGRVLLGKAYTETDRGIKLRKRVVAATTLALLALGTLLFFRQSQQPSPLTALSRGEFNQAFLLDSDQYRQLDAGLEHAAARIEAMPSLAAPSDEVLSADDEAALLDAWASIFDHTVALDQIREFYEDSYRFDPSRADRSRHLRGFLLSYASELALYEKSVRVAAVVLRDDNARKFLDAPHPERGLPPASFSRFRTELQGSRDQARVVAGAQYMRLLRAGFAGPTEAASLGVGWLWTAAERHLAVIDRVAPIDRTVLQLRGDTQPLGRAVHRVWYPTQKTVAEELGDTRVRRIGWYLVEEEQIAAMEPALQPGDVALSRKNWYLSNVGLPGFWPHAMLYLGDPDKFTAYFDDTEVNAWLARTTGHDWTLGEYLARTWPARWLRYQVGEAVEGDSEAHHPYVLMEAISEGVSFNTWTHAAGDYLAVLRPRLDKVAKAQAIVHAFADLDKPYDFNFDFATDHALVCTELIWRAYRPAEGKAGLEIPLVNLAGRATLPANDLARFFAEQADTDAQQLDFVWFYDAIEKEQRAVLSDETTFRTSWERTKWDVAQR